MKKLFDTDGLVLGYEVFLFRGKDSGRFYLYTDRHGGNQVTLVKDYMVKQAAVRTKVSIEKRLGIPTHDDLRQLARTKSSYYDDRWDQY